MQDYVMLVPAVQFDAMTVLDVQGIDMSSEFIKNCGADNFHIRYAAVIVVVVLVVSVVVS